MKRCPGCRQVLELHEFGPNRAHTSGIQGYCRPCCREKAQASYRTDRYTPEEKLERRLRYRYNFPLADYQALLLNGCAICGELEEARLCVDHDRSCCPRPTSCGACVRGLLCRRHNAALGLFNDNPELLRRAAQYLEARRPI